MYYNLSVIVNEVVLAYIYAGLVDEHCKSPDNQLMSMMMMMLMFGCIYSLTFKQVCLLNLFVTWSDVYDASDALSC